MYCVVRKDGTQYGLMSSSNVGKYDTGEWDIFYIQQDNIVKYEDGKFYTDQNTEYTGEIINVTDLYLDLSDYDIHDIQLGESLEIVLPYGKYEIYYNRQLVGTFNSDGKTSKVIKPKNIGRYLITCVDRPCAQTEFIVYEPIVEII